MELKFYLTEEDYLNFNMFHIKNSKTAKRTLRMQRFLPPVIFIIFSYVLSKLGNISFPGVFIVYLIVSILWIIFYPKYYYHYVSRHTKKMIKEGKNEGFLGERQMILTEEGVRNYTQFSDGTVSWSGIKSFKEDRNAIYLYNSAVSALIIPKRELRNVDEIRDYIKSKL